MNYFDQIVEIVNRTKPDGLTKRLKSKALLWNEICSWSTAYPEIKGAEKIYLYYHQITEKPICSCGSGKHLSFISFTLGYNKFCSGNCPSSWENRKKVVQENGKKFGLANQSAKVKAEETLLKTQGVLNPGQILKHREMMKVSNPMFTEQAKQSLLKHYEEKYGVFNNSQKHIDPEIIKRLQNPGLIQLELKKKTLQQLALEWNIRYSYLRKRCIEWNLIEKRQIVPESEISNWLSDRGIQFKRNTKSIIKPLQLDFFIPSKSIAIEHCGLYWHGEENKIHKEYHYTKWKRCNDLGIQLLTIFEDEYLEKPFIVYSSLENKLSLSSKSIFARNCQIKVVDKNTADLFFDKTHIQGATNSVSVSFGLFCQEEMVACMSFKRLGKQIFKRHQNKVQNVWLLNRFSSSIRVVGGFSKLLNYFKKIESADCIITYADLRWSNGGLYTSNGFTEEGLSPPDYWYYKNQKRYHKFGFRKTIMGKYGANPNFTEKELVSELGFSRIWDCGKLRFAWYR